MSTARRSTLLAAVATTGLTLLVTAGADAVSASGRAAAYDVLYGDGYRETTAYDIVWDDGLHDHWEFDTDLDGFPNFSADDLDQDGDWDHVVYDSNGDGVPDTSFEPRGTAGSITPSQMDVGAWAGALVALDDLTGGMLLRSAATELPAVPVE